jgi:hypothetical protein
MAKMGAATGFSQKKADALKGRAFDADAPGYRLLPYERLDQKLFDIVMGV